MKFYISVLLFSLVLQASAQIWLSKVAEFLKETARRVMEKHKVYKNMHAENYINGDKYQYFYRSGESATRSKHGEAWAPKPNSDFWKNWQMGCGSGNIDIAGTSDTGDGGSGAEDTLAVKKERDRNHSKRAHFPWNY
ncbi:PREDICTED: serum amyloid A protein-like [Gavialis gangeticus]|uniref:serum amyloid A protein-like n=1 Tax=Gavialis gangeticus TaxID=94835 RepID=UPI00092F322E|nr:PREDICTED: serum amyloid A protein-like [Gavialis gangeticus]